MELDTDVQMKEESTAPQAATEDELGEELSDPLAEGGDESVQMILPPKPGAGPKVSDTFRSVDEVLADETP